MYVPILISPKQGDIIERYCIHRRELVGVFLVINPRKTGRKDLMEAWCLYNGHYESKFNKFKGLKAGSKVSIHRITLVSEHEAEQTGEANYYVVRKQ